MLINLLKLILLWWIISVVVRWYRRRFSERGPRKSKDLWGDKNDTAPKDPGSPLVRSTSGVEMVYSGKIEDAEFEEIDDRKRKSS